MCKLWLWNSQWRDRWTRNIKAFMKDSFRNSAVSTNHNIPGKLGQYHSCCCPGPWFNIKMSSYQYRKYHCGDKTAVRSSYLHNGISYTGKMISFYWIGPLVPSVARSSAAIVLTKDKRVPGFLTYLASRHYRNQCSFIFNSFWPIVTYRWLSARKM